MPRFAGGAAHAGALRQPRNGDAAVLAEMQAIHLDKLVKKQIAPGAIYTDLPLATGGELSLSTDGVQSSTIGDLAFMTPISELKFNEVTKSEAEACL